MTFSFSLENRKGVGVRKIIIFLPAFPAVTTTAEIISLQPLPATKNCWPVKLWFFRDHPLTFTDIVLVWHSFFSIKQHKPAFPE